MGEKKKREGDCVFVCRVWGVDTMPTHVQSAGRCAVPPRALSALLGVNVFMQTSVENAESVRYS